MPQQNRVTPFGEIVADPARGLFMGNRGILHGANAKLSTARWRHTHWIICLTEFRQRHRVVMTPGRYTELFFADEAVALAAGHRPCAECRRAAYNDFRRAWQAGGNSTELPRAGDIDAALHRQRVVSRTRQQISYAAKLSSLPHGAFFIHPRSPGIAVLKTDDGSWRWSQGGYAALAKSELDPDEMVAVLTPQASVAALSAGYRPELLNPKIS